MLTKQEEHDIQAFLDSMRAALPGYCERPSQRLMMHAVADALDHCRHGEDTRHTDGSNFLVCESGTGTGKTFSYTIPGIVLARSVGKKLVISTSTIALQEQLTQKDLPLLQAHAPVDFTFALAKGRARYVCPTKLRTRAAGASQWSIDLEGKPDEGADHAEAATLTSLAARLATGAWDGDRDRLTEDVPATTWSSITTDRTGCSGNRCPDFVTCPFYRARQQARDADVIVVNHDISILANS